jgi:hypothetical protein
MVSLVRALPEKVLKAVWADLIAFIFSILVSTAFATATVSTTGFLTARGFLVLQPNASKRQQIATEQVQRALNRWKTNGDLFNVFSFIYFSI